MVKRQVLVLLALGGAAGLAACGNILGLKDLEPYPPEGGAEEGGGGDAPDESSSDSPATGDDTSTRDAREATTTDAREDGAVPMTDATEEDTTAEVGPDVSSDTSTNDGSTNDVVTTMDAPQDTTPPMDAPPGCEGGEVSCGGTCTDLNTSQHHCSSCNHDCLGGACVAGVCQPYVFAIGPVAHDMVVAAGTLYWVDEGSPGTVAGCSVSLQSCTPNTVASNQADPTRITYDGSSCLYWSNYNGGSNGGSVGSLQVGSSPCLGPFTALGSPQGIAANGTYVFWADTYNKAIVQATSSTRSQFVVASPNGNPPPVAVAVLGNSIYWANDGSMSGQGSVWEGATGANFPNPKSQVAGSLTFPWSFAVWGTSVYWVDYDVVNGSGDVWTATGPAATQLAGSQSEPVRVAADANAVYWVNQGSGASNGELRTCNPASCSTNTLVKGGLGQPEGLALTSTDVFFSLPASTLIYRLVRP